MVEFLIFLAGTLAGAVVALLFAAVQIRNMLVKAEEELNDEWKLVYKVYKKIK